MTTNGHATAHRNGHNGHTSRAVPPDALPPQNLEAERGVLGAVLLDNDVLPGVLRILEAGDFYRDSHQTIYRRIVELHRQGRPADAITLADALQRRGELERVGGDDALASILSSVPHAANAVYYAEIVRKKARTRELIDAADQIIREGYGNGHTADELVELGRSRIDHIRARSGRRGAFAALTCMGDVEARAVRWLWPGRIPLGMITLLAGDPNLGKSFVTCALAAAVSAGSRWPDDPAGDPTPAGDVVMLSAEDALAETIRPRLDANGADCARVHALTGVRGEDGRPRPFRLADGLPQLDAALEGLPNARLVVIDPISAYLGGADEHKNADVRGLLGPLKDLAERRSVAVVLVTHLNKGAGTKAIYRSTGSLAFQAAARMSWLFVKDRHDPRRRLMLPAKTNVAADPGGLAYRIESGVVQWEAAPVALAADEALADESSRSSRRQATPERIEQAARWLAELLDGGKEVPSEDVLREGRGQGFSRHVLFDAKAQLDIRARKSSFDGGWVWRLPDAPPPPPDDDRPY